MADLLAGELLDLLFSEEAAEGHHVVARVGELDQDRRLLHQRHYHLAVVADPEYQRRVPRKVLAQVAHRVLHRLRGLQTLLHVEEDGQKGASRALGDPLQQTQVVLGSLKESVLPRDQDRAEVVLLDFLPTALVGH